MLRFPKNCSARYRRISSLLALEIPSARTSMETISIFSGSFASSATETASFSVENYRIIEKCQFWKQHNWNDSMEAMCDAILEKTPDEDNEAVVDYIEAGIISCKNNRLSAEFPVFGESVFEEVKEILRPVSESVADCMKAICNRF